MTEKGFLFMQPKKILTTVLSIEISLQTVWFAFKLAPHLFYQVCTIHCLCKEATLPMFYFFL